MQPGYVGAAEGSEVARVVAESLRSQLAEWERRLPGVSVSAQAAAALKLAEILDALEPRNATAASNIANSLDRVLERLESGIPPLVEGDEIDELRAKRERRRAG